MLIHAHRQEDIAVYCQPFQVPSVRQGEAAWHSARSTCQSKPLVQGNRKSNADKEKPVRKEGKSRIKDRGSDFLVVIYDPKFF